MRYLLLTLFLALISLPAFAQKQEPECFPYKILADQLKKNFNEEPAEGGSAPDAGGLLTIFESPGGKTWTAVMVGKKSDGTIIACPVFYGKNWATTRTTKK